MSEENTELKQTITHDAIEEIIEEFNNIDDHQKDEKERFLLFKELVVSKGYIPEIAAMIDYGYYVIRKQTNN
jgi:predicted ArsR family transcriptional regulator